MPVRAPVGMALSALLLASAAAGETVVRELGPLKLEGPTKPMEGPQADGAVHFDHAGYITAHRVDILDAAGRSRVRDGLHCHSIFHREGGDDSVALPGAAYLRSEPVRLGTSDNQAEILFPAGFGVYVDSSTPYGVSGMLTDPEGAHGGEYRMRYTFELAPADPPLKRLRGLLVKIPGHAMPDGKECGHAGEWMVPSGRHVYETAFTMPETARVHYMSAHVHAHARELALVDPRGRVLHRAPVVLGERGQPVDSPLYSSAEGLLLRKGARYVFRVVYENPGAAPIDAMANLRLFVEDGS
jgi:hypothetical protein